MEGKLRRNLRLRNGQAQTTIDSAISKASCEIYETLSKGSEMIGLGSGRGENIVR